MFDYLADTAYLDASLAQTAPVKLTECCLMSVMTLYDMKITEAEWYS